MRLLIKEGSYSRAASIFLFTKFLRPLLKGSFYSRAASIEENTVCTKQNRVFKCSVIQLSCKYFKSPLLLVNVTLCY